MFILKYHRALILFSGFTRFATARYLVKVKHIARMFGNTLVMSVGMILISLACYYNKHQVAFYLSLFSSVLLGSAAALGESTILGYCKGLPSTFVGYFGSGTGFAGIFGSGVILMFKAFAFTEAEIFLLLTPSVALYYFSFWWLNNTKQKHIYINEYDDYDQKKNDYTDMEVNDTLLSGNDQ